MQKTDMLPTIEEEALDGVTGGAPDLGILIRNVMSISIKTRLSAVGMGFSAVGGIMKEVGDFLRGDQQSP